MAKKKPILRKPIKKIEIPVSDLRRLMTDLSYDTIELVAKRVRKMLAKGDIDAMVGIEHNDYGTKEWMEHAVKIALMEIETSYEDAGKMIRNKIYLYKEWRTTN